MSSTTSTPNPIIFDLIALTKPRVNFLIIFTAIVGMLLARSIPTIAVKMIRKFTLGLVRAIRSNIIGLGVEVVLLIYCVFVNDIRE